MNGNEELTRSEARPGLAGAEFPEVPKALADETRLRIVSLLWEAEDLCSCEIEAILDVNQSNASRHLSRLRYVGLLSYEKRGLWVHFQPNRSASETYPVLPELIESARREVPRFGEELEGLRDYRGSGFDCKTIDRWRGRRAGGESR